MYEVVILAEQAMTAGDAHEVVSLHEDIDDSRHYHVLVPCADAAQDVGAALGTVAASEAVTAPQVFTAEVDVATAQDEIERGARDAVTASVAAIRSQGVEASGEFTSADPVARLTEVVAERGAAEVVVMTLPHSVSELLHLDWTSKARRRLGVPILHLLEHEPLDAEAGYGQGISGM